MPCNAIATATARVSNQELMKHVDMTQLREILVDFLEKQGHTITHQRNGADVVSVETGTISISVNRYGQVTVRDYGRRSRQPSQVEKDLAGEIKTLVDNTAGIMFQAKMIETISDMLPVLGTDVIETELGEAVVMNVTLNGLVSRVIIMPNGEVSVYTDEGTFTDGADGIRELFDSLGAEVTFESISEPEQHRHDDAETAHVHLHQHLHEHNDHRH